jgi:peptide-methionine (R)-S-oxide reductase
MRSRRQFLFAAGSALTLGMGLSWFGAGRASTTVGDKRFPSEKTDTEWRRLLTPDQYRVLRGHATERAFTSPLNNEKRTGTFVCAGCGHPLFASETKFESGTGWPSFWTPLPNGVGTQVDRSWLMVRTEVHCANCGGHLGHVFEDGPKPTGLRYCMNGVALQFKPAA